MYERCIYLLPLTSPALGTWPATQACALTGIRTSNLSVCRLALSRMSHTSQDCLPLLFFSDFCSQKDCRFLVQISSCLSRCTFRQVAVESGGGIPTAFLPSPRLPALQGLLLCVRFRAFRLVFKSFVRSCYP